MNLLEINEIVVLTKIIFQKFTQNQNPKKFWVKKFLIINYKSIVSIKPLSVNKTIVFGRLVKFQCDGKERRRLLS